MKYLNIQNGGRKEGLKKQKENCKYQGTMSLVSYAASDDSGDEDVNKPQMQENERGNENKAVKHSTTYSQQLPSGGQNEVEPQETSGDNGRENTKPKSIGSFFSSLPAPWMSTISWASKKPGTKRKGRGQTVKISLPNLADNSDSDHEEETVRKNQNPVSEKPSGLFSLLPKPKHSVVVKENNPNRPVAKISNRPLIPDSLRKKQVKKTTPHTKKDASDDDSDDDGTGGSFFSWNEQKTSIEPSTSQVIHDADSVANSDQVRESNINVPLTTESKDVLPSTKPSSLNNVIKIPSGTTQRETKNTESYLKPASVPNTDTSKHSQYLGNKNFHAYTNAHGYSQQGSTNLEDYSAGWQENSKHTSPYYDYYNSEQYNQAVLQQEPNYPQNMDCQAPAEPTQDAVQETPEQFRRFLGKRGRGEQNINIIDVNADDQVGPSQDWKSQYQKEDADYKPQSKKKDNLPSSQQRRKHQITYLAFQAKEKEWELRNQWSANRQTRRQTQSKYGF